MGQVTKSAALQQYILKSYDGKTPFAIVNVVYLDTSMADPGSIPFEYNFIDITPNGEVVKLNP